jgi:uncharacterized protein (DUF433 family)
MVDWREHIESDPLICSGEPRARGTRVTVATILASLADGDSPEVLLRAYPSLTTDHIRAALATIDGALVHARGGSPS